MLGTRDIQLICDLYRCGRSSAEIAPLFKVHPTTIKYHLKRNNVVMRDPYIASMERSRRHSFNESFFNEIDSEEKAYWLGFLAADGCVTKDSSCKMQNRLSIGLSIKDKEHLFKFKQSLQATHPIRDISNFSYFEVRSVNMCTDLIKHGLVPRKSLILEWPKSLPFEYLRHYLRGHFDGDGSVYIQKKQLVVKFCAPYDFIVNCRNYLNNILNHKGGNIWESKSLTQLTYRGNKVNKKIFDYLYHGASIWLPRKYNQFIKILGSDSE